MPQRRLEQYLRQATQGLYGKKRVQVARELRGNLLARAREFMAFGSSEAQALERALDEFGAAKAVSRGFYEVYTMPVLNKITAMLGLLGLSAYLSLSATAVGVRYTLESPVPVCAFSVAGQLNASPCVLENTSWLELNSMLETFWVQGVDVRMEELDAVDGPEETPVRLISLYFPGEPNPATLKTVRSSGTKGKNALTLTRFEQGDKTFVETAALLEALAALHLPLKVSGFLNPTLEFAGAKLELGSQSAPVNIQAGLERWVSKSITSLPRVIPFSADGKPFEVPEMRNPLDPFQAVTLTSSHDKGDFRYTRPVYIENSTAQFFLLMTHSIYKKEGKMQHLLGLEMIERDINDNAFAYSLPLNPRFVSSIEALYKGGEQDVLLLPVRFDQPYDILDTKNPYLPRAVAGQK